MPTYVLYNDMTRSIDMDSVAEYLEGSDIALQDLETADRSLEAEVSMEQRGRFEELVQSQGFRYRIENVYVYRPSPLRGS